MFAVCAHTRCELNIINVGDCCSAVSVYERNDNMKTVTFAFPSVTLASKAQSVLEQNGVKARLVRTPRTLASGCGYSVAAETDTAKAAALLSAAGLHYKAVSES